MLKPAGIVFSNVIVIIISIGTSKSYILRKNAMEGTEIDIEFNYPCNSSRITLQIETGAPFFDSEIPKAMSLPENKKLEVNTDVEKNHCFIRMKFTPVLRSDEGGYILTAYKDRNVVDDTIARLTVAYLPGKASCAWGDEIAPDEWRSIECSASSGSMPGEIICCQNNINVPPKKSPRNIDNILEQTLWVRYSEPAFCCAVAVGTYTDKCNCKDYIWDPFHVNLTEPCNHGSVTTIKINQEASTSQSPTFIPGKEVTGKTRNNHVGSPGFLIGILVISIIVNVVLIFYTVMLYRNKRKALHGNGNMGKTFSHANHVNKEYKTVATVVTCVSESP